MTRDDIELIAKEKSTPVVEALAPVAEVESILCFGSYAMGMFDEHSDIDLYVLCRPEVISLEMRRVALLAIPDLENLQLDYTEEGWDNAWHPHDDRCQIGRLNFEISYNTVSWVRDVVDGVRSGISALTWKVIRPHTILGLLDCSVILHDPHAVLQQLRGSLYPYPASLKQALIHEHLSIARGSLAELQDYVKRSIGNTAFHFHYERVVDSIGCLLFAINERYDPATKRAEQAFMNLAILPHRFVERYTRLLETPLTFDRRKEIADKLSQLLTEVLELNHARKL